MALYLDILVGRWRKHYCSCEYEMFRPRTPTHTPDRSVNQWTHNFTFQHSYHLCNEYTFIRIKCRLGYQGGAVNAGRENDGPSSKAWNCRTWNCYRVLCHAFSRPAFSCRAFWCLVFSPLVILMVRHFHTLLLGPSFSRPAFYSLCVP